MFISWPRTTVLTLGAALLLAATMFACKESPLTELVPPTPNPSPWIPIGTRWEHPFPQGSDLNRIWGFPNGTFYAVGDAGTVLYYNGSSWTLLETPVREDLHGIWASDVDDVYAAGFGSMLIHYDGLEWSTVPTPKHDDFYAVWASTTSDIFVAGTGGNIWNHVNGIWTQYPVAPGRRFRALWGYSHNEVYAAGSNGALFRFNGSSWSKMTVFGTPNYDPEIRDIWGPTPGSIAFVDGRNILWFDGTAWGGDAVRDENAYGLWGFSFGDQVAVSAGSATHLVDGFETVRHFTPTEEPLFDVWGTSVNNYYAVGRHGNIAHFNGTSWQPLNLGSVDDLRDVWVSASAAIAVGRDGAVLRQDGSTWDEESLGSGYELWGVWSSGDGLDVTVGRFTPDGLNWRQAVLTSAGTSWVDAGEVGTAHRLFDVWGSSSSDVYAVGWAGEILHYDGRDWSVAVPGDSLQTAMLRSVSGTSASNVVAVGRTNDLQGVVLRFDGTQWARTELADVEELCGVWAYSPSSVFTVGSNGAIRHFDGTAWVAATVPTDETLFGVWGTNQNDVYAVGWEGAIVHYDGSHWTRLIPTTNRTLYAVSGRSSNNVVFVGDKGGILSFDGYIDESQRILATHSSRAFGR